MIIEERRIRYLGHLKWTSYTVLSGESVCWKCSEITHKDLVLRISERESVYLLSTLWTFSVKRCYHCLKTTSSWITKKKMKLITVKRNFPQASWRGDNTKSCSVVLKTSLRSCGRYLVIWIPVSNSNITFPTTTYFHEF